MVVRKVGILVMVTLAVFAGAGGGWEVARRWRKGWIEATATLVVSKLLMTVVFLLGISAMGKTEAKDGIAALADAMAGIVIMVLVLLCPYADVQVRPLGSRRHRRRAMHRAGVAGCADRQAHAEKAARKAAAAAATAGTGGAAAGAGAAPQGPDASGEAASPATSPPTRPAAERATKVRKAADRASRPVAMPSSPVWRRPSSPRRRACPTTPAARWAAARGRADPARVPRPARPADGSPAPPTTTPPPQGAPPSSGSRTPRPAGRPHRRRLRPASDPLPTSRGRDVHARLPPPGSTRASRTRPLTDLSVAPVTVKFPHRSRRGILLGLSLPQLILVSCTLACC